MLELGAKIRSIRRSGHKWSMRKRDKRDSSFSGAPSEGLQFFGHVSIDGMTEVMTVTLKDADDHALWSARLEPKTT